MTPKLSHTEELKKEIQNVLDLAEKEYKEERRLGMFSEDMFVRRVARIGIKQGYTLGISDTKKKVLEIIDRLCYTDEDKNNLIDYEEIKAQLEKI